MFFNLLYKSQLRELFIFIKIIKNIINFEFKSSIKKLSLPFFHYFILFLNFFNTLIKKTKNLRT